MKAGKIAAVATAAAGLYLYAIAPRITRRKQMESLKVDYAHRGLHDDIIPENSISAFARAVEEGLGIELDVRQSADGTLYVFHDDDLKRMCGVEKKFKECTDTEIDALTLKDTDEHIPRFSQVLELVNGQIPLLVEIKGDIGDKTVASAVAKMLDNYDGAFLVESFNSFILGWFKKNRPSILRGQLYTDLDKSPKALRAFVNSMMINTLSRPDFIAYDIKHEKKPLLRLCLTVFNPIRFVWTVKTPEDLEKCRSNRKIDGVIFENVSPDISFND